MYNNFIFHCGGHPEISYEELKSLNVQDLQFINKNTLIGASELDGKTLQKMLGGTKKVSEVIQAFQSVQAVQKAINEYLLNKETEGKTVYGVNIYAGRQFVDRHLAPILKNTRQALKKNKKSCRYLNKGPRNINDVDVQKSLHKKGCTVFELFEKNGTILLAKICAVQNIDAYSLRDYRKPFRDAKNGMMPPKLVQIMMNMATHGKHHTIYDPFCGSGTTLLEGLILNHKVIGSDYSEKMVEGTKQNIEFIEHKMKTDPKNVVRVFHHDASKPFPSDIKPTAVVSETYLGPPLYSVPPQSKIDSIFLELRELHNGFFKEIAKVLPKGAMVVVTFPTIEGGGRSLNFSRMFPAYEHHGFKLHPFKNGKKMLVYGRSNQVVHRGIARFERV